jgi:hypothetical protein
MNDEKTSMQGIEQLQLFLMRADELLNSRLVKNGLNTGFTMSFDQISGIRFSSQEPDEEDLRSFLLTFRQFVSDEEPVYLYRIYNLCHMKILSDELKNHLIEGRKEWKRSLTHGGFKLVWNESEFQPEKVLDLWINGVYFHNDSQKREFLDKIAPHQKMLLRQVFLNAITDGVRQVMFVSYIIKAAMKDGLIRS